MGLFSRRRPEREAREPDPLEVVRAYQRGTRHDFQRFAAGPMELDWATQPDPFLRYAGAERIELERAEPESEPRFETAYRRGAVAPRAFDRASLSQLFFDSLAISAWKQYGESRWALRCNPSSGNLHPTEAYLIAPGAVGLGRALIAHYAADLHALEVRAQPSPALAAELTRGVAEPCAFVALTSIAWREAWKYGERAFRYCQLDLGHALGALAVAAAALGWRARRLDGLSSDELAALCGIEGRGGPEREEPQTLVLLQPPDAPEPRFDPGPDLAPLARSLAWRGAPSQLSPDHVDWPALDAVAAATRKARTRADPTPAQRLRLGADGGAPESIGLRQVLRRRRSATAFDPQRTLARERFLRTLARTLAGHGHVPSEVIPGEARVDLALWVHRVVDLESGVYLLLRDPRRLPAWRAALRAQVELAEVDTAPYELALWRLRRGDVRAQARSLACHQEIASDGCFAAAACADLTGELDRRGPRAYRELHWEAGWLVHLLYLEAEAAGLAGTGIGCFFDQPTRAALGLGEQGPECLYQFACGGRRDDPRLTTLPAYT